MVEQFYEDKFNFTKRLSGYSKESQDVVNSFKEKFSEMISGSEEDIFNADEYGLLI
jgi:hypothetical protein